jgi:alanine racemase
MNNRRYTASDIARITGGKLIPPTGIDPEITDLLIDSRRLIHPEGTLFIALMSSRNDGHRYIEELHGKGVRCFMVQEPVTLGKLKDAVIILVGNTLTALQSFTAFHRSQFDIPVIAVTGSNGKTIVKEWLYQILSPDIHVIRSPKSYNSQVGVPLSVWKMEASHNLAIFEAGISRPGEMEKIETVIHPTIGILTNIGSAHDEYFKDRWEKLQEKMKLFRNAELLIYCMDHAPVHKLVNSQEYSHLRTFTWSMTRQADLTVTMVEKLASGTKIKALFQKESILFTIPFTDEASIENALHCLSCMIVLETYQTSSSLVTRHSSLVTRLSSLHPVALRLELKEAVNRCSLINDSYNSDFQSLIIAIDFLNQQNQHKKHTVILSDILQTGRKKEELYREVAVLLEQKKIDRLIGIGPDISGNAEFFTMEKRFFLTTDDFLSHFPVSSFQDEAILLKGARLFEFEQIDNLLQQKSHETVLEINLDALIHNLNYYRSLLEPGTKLMAMVKAFSYGSGSYEIANVLQYHQVDYLAVAYADEGVELRKAGIRLPIMVMSPEEQSPELLLQYNLEPEIYNFKILDLLEEAIEQSQISGQEVVKIHIKLDTGMHRLGFINEELGLLTRRLQRNPALYVQSVFSHLAASEDPAEDPFTQEQIRRFKEMSSTLTKAVGHPLMLHILNSAGISRFPEARCDMVRLGIGMYGIGCSPEEQEKLRNVSTLRTVITQIREVEEGDTIGYNRSAKASKKMMIAIIPVGYADGFDRRLGNGKGSVFIHGSEAPTVGNICMDLTLIDITHLVQKGKEIREGDEVIVFGDVQPVTELARRAGTIPYEILTGISHRVKRIYFYE